MNLEKGIRVYLDDVKDWEKYEDAIQLISKKFIELLSKNLIKTVINFNTVQRKKKWSEYSNIWEFIKSFFISKYGKRESDVWIELVSDLDVCYLNISSELYKMIVDEKELKEIREKIKAANSPIIFPISNNVIDKVLSLLNKHKYLLKEIR